MSFENRKTRVGTVVSDKMDKSVIVSVAWRTQHPRYRKSIRKRSRLMVHDPEGQVSVGDLVRIVEVRPLSKMKRWRISEVIARQEVVEIPSAEEIVREAIPDEPTPMPASKKKRVKAEPEEAVEQVVEEEEKADEVVEEEAAKPKPRKSRAKPSAKKTDEPAEETEPEAAVGPEASIEVEEVKDEPVLDDAPEVVESETESVEGAADESADSEEEQNNDEEKERQ